MKYDFEKYVDSFKKIMTDTWLTPRGAMFSEGFALSSIIHECESQLIIESGTAYGGSAEMLALLCKKKPLISIDNYELYPDSEQYSKDRMQKYKDVKLLKGDSLQLIPEILEITNLQKIAIFIDGPKGENAGNFVFSLLHEFREKIDFIAVHDVKYDSESAEIYNRTFSDLIPSNILYTDDPQDYFSFFREQIDNHMLQINKQKCKESVSSLKKIEGLGFLQSALQESPRGYGMVIIKPE